MPRTGDGGGASGCPGPARRSTSSHVLSVTSSNTPSLRQALITLHRSFSISIRGPSSSGSLTVLEADPTAAIANEFSLCKRENSVFRCVYVRGVCKEKRKNSVDTAEGE